jgi:hypothetical protein
MPITTINIGSTPNDGTGDTIRDSFDICNDNFQDLDTTKYDIPTGTITQYVRGDGTLATLPTAGTSDKLITEVSNQTGSTLLKGTIVYINGSHGNLPTVTPSQANNDTNSAQTLGFVQNDIANNGTGFVVVAGKITDLNTSTFTAGVQLYLSPTIPGGYTITKQFAPNHLVYVGVVVRSHPTQGTIEVKIQNGYELDELHDVSAQTPSNNDGLFFETATSLWKNKTIATALGYIPANEDLFSRLSKGWEASTDFISPLFNDGWTSRVTGTGAVISTSNSIFGTNKNGICIATTGSTATGFAGPEFGSPNNGFGFSIGNGQLIFEHLLMIPTLSNATERFVVYSGIVQPAAFAAPQNGIFFYYDEGGILPTSQINWKCYTSSTSTRTLTTSSIQVNANQWYKLKAVINAAATSVGFYIDGTLVATHTTNLPSTSLGYALNSSIQKTTGTTARTLQIDYAAIAQTLTTPR